MPSWAAGAAPARPPGAQPAAGTSYGNNYSVADVENRVNAVKGIMCAHLLSFFCDARADAHHAATGV